MENESVLDENIYSLYIHTNLNNNKVYIGITYKKSDERWNDGEGYRHNYELYSDIREFGWEKGFNHKIVADNLSYEKAKEAESYFIDIFDATNPEKGYNHRRGGISYGKRREVSQIGEKIKQLRKAKGVTQFELADILGLSRATISNYEVNRRTPHLAELKLFADYFGVTLDFFGPVTKDVSFEISSRVVEYFKSSEIEFDDKVGLFNDIISAYNRYILQNQ